MPAITALIHTRNDARRIGRALESLRPCERFVVVDRGSSDGTTDIARQYGAVVVPEEAALASIGHDWVLLLEPHEALSEALESTLYQWKQQEPSARAYAVRIREETAVGWELRPAETRLLHRSVLHATGGKPDAIAEAPLLEGDLLRFSG